MPWWASVYLVLYAMLCGVAAVIDIKRRQRGAWHVTLDVVAASVLLTFAIARWHSGLVTPLGRWASVVLVLVVGWDVYSTSRDIAEITYDHSRTAQENARAEWAGLVVTAFLMAPVYALAIASVMQAWRAT